MPALLKFEAILLKKVKYGESNLIAQTFTREEGNMAFFLPGRLLKGKNKVVLPSLSHVEVIASDRKNGMPQIREIRHKEHYYDLLSNIHKTSMAVFMNEVLLKCLREHGKDEAIFESITNFLEVLDKDDLNPDLHLIYLVKLASEMGFGMHNGLTEQSSHYDLYEACFCNEEPLHGHCITPDQLSSFKKLLSSESNRIFSASSERRQMLNYLMTFYSLHFEQFEEPKSREILEEVLS